MSIQELDRGPNEVSRKRFQTRLQALAAACVIAATPLCSEAALIVYTVQADWEAAVTGTIQVEDFNSVAVGALSTGTNSAGLIDIEIIGDAGFNAIGASGATDGTRFFLGEVDNSAPDIGSPDLVFGSDIIAFGADWISTATAAILIANAAGDTVNFLTELGIPGSGFLGVISDSSFTTVELRASGALNEVFEMDNLRFVEAGVPDPEPATLAVLALGLIGVAVRRRRHS